MRHDKLILTVVLAIASVAAGARADVPEPPPPPPRNDCVPDPSAWTREKLEQVALAEIEKRFAQKFLAGQFEAQLTRTACDWWVIVRAVPAERGRNFSAMIDARGKVKWVNKIDV